jgi:hypothetical protein
VYQALGIFKPANSGEELKFGTINLGDDSNTSTMTLAKTLPLQQVIQFNAIVSTNSKKPGHSLFFEPQTKIEITQKTSFSELKNLLEQTFPNNCMTLEQAYNLAKTNNKLNYDELYFIRGDMGSDGIRVTKETSNSDVLTIVENGDPEKLLQAISEGKDPLTATVWLNKKSFSIPRNIAINAMDLIIVGRPGIKVRDDVESLNIAAQSILVDEKYLVSQDAQDVSPTSSEELL